MYNGEFLVNFNTLCFMFYTGEYSHISDGYHFHQMLRCICIFDSDQEYSVCLKIQRMKKKNTKNVRKPQLILKIIAYCLNQW